MAVFTKESLEALRQRIDLVDFLTPYIELKRSGAAFKALCPFHDEKSPSFMIQKGDRHYHCFGCGAHGDAIHFLLTREGLTFREAVEMLAEKFSVPLELSEDTQEQSRIPLIKASLDKACLFFQYMLLHSEEGRAVLSYLIKRGIGFDFIKRFRIGLAPKNSGLFRKFMHEAGFYDDILEEAGLLAKSKEFFLERITFPVHNPSGAVIGFSARKHKESTFGGKYVNTKETPLFKKSRILFGLNYSRRRIAKERRAIVVEGQLDALRLIYEGFDLAVAAQGTAFGKEHADELIRLGVQTVFLALDGDSAGAIAACKIGDLFLKEGIEAKIIPLPPDEDPDSFVRKNGASSFESLLNESIEFIEFLFKHLSKQKDLNSPAVKTQIISEIKNLVKEWKSDVLIHEGLKKLALVAKLPESTLLSDMGIKQMSYVKKEAFASHKSIDPHRILECDFLRWLILSTNDRAKFLNWAKQNIPSECIYTETCRIFYQNMLDAHLEGRSFDLIEEAQDHQLLLQEILEKKVDKSKAEAHFKETMSKILLRRWMEMREVIKNRIQSGMLTEEEAFALAKEFDNLRKNQPELKLEE